MGSPLKGWVFFTIIRCQIQGYFPAFFTGGELTVPKVNLIKFKENMTPKEVPYEGTHGVETL
jgi:hypothetical protein